MLEKRITAADVGVQCDANQKPLILKSTSSASSQRNPRDELATRLEREISGDYIEKNNLKATEQEIREFQDYQDRFMAQDRIRRQKKPADFDKKLRSANLSPKEREQTRERMGAPPELPAKPEEIDFTPYWKKPLPKEPE